MANVVYTGFDPEFGNRLNRLIALAKAEGYTPNLISGTRAAYAWPGMKGQSQEDLYNQLGKPGGPKAAAPPGYSPHQYGVASDVTGIPQSELERLATQVGLRAIHSDPNHVELANWQAEAAAQPPRTAWNETNPANVPSRMAMNMEAGGPPGTTINMTSFPTDRRQTTPAQRAQFIRNYIQATYPGKDANLGIGIAGAEGLNAGGLGASRVDIDPRTGQPFSFGDFQMNVRNGLGNLAQKAGFDPTNPNQWQDVDKFAIDTMYGPKQGYNLAPWKGDKFATAYQQSGVVGSPTIAGGAGTQPPVAGDIGPSDRTIAAGGPGTIASGVTPAPTGKDMFGAGFGALAKSAPEALDKASGSGQQAKGPDANQQLAMQQAAAPLEQEQRQRLMAQSAPAIAQMLANARKPLSWSGAPPGSMMGAGVGQAPQAAPAVAAAMMNQSPTQMPQDQMMALMQQQIPGTTLNSMGDGSYG